MYPPTSNKISDVVMWGQKALIEHGITNAHNEIRWILEKKLNLYYSQENYKDYQLNSKEFSIIFQFVNRRVSHEPFQYILNLAPFYGREFFVNKHVLIPRPETEEIIEILKYKRFKDAIDVGTGSGNLAISLRLENIAENIVATDISEKSIQIAKVNAQKHQVSNIKFQKHNIILDKLSRKYNLVVSNPPYINIHDYDTLPQHIKNYEPKIALTDFGDGYIYYKRFSKLFASIVKPKGVMVLEIGLESTVEAIEAIFKPLNVPLIWSKDLNGDKRIISIFNE